MKPVCENCGRPLEGMALECDGCGWSDGPVGSLGTSAILVSSAVLILSLAIVIVAVFGISQSGFWKAAPVLLNRALDK